MSIQLDFVPRNAPAHAEDPLAAARGIINALGLTFCAAIPFLVFWAVVEFGGLAP